MKGFFKDFKEFISKGSVIDLAIGVIIGGAFGSIVSSLVNDIIMPVVSLATGGLDFSNLFVALDGKKYATLKAATDAGAATLNYGKFINAVVYFLIIALCIFLVLRAILKAKKKAESLLKKEEEEEEEEEPTEKDLLMEIRDLLAEKNSSSENDAPEEKEE